MKLGPSLEDANQYGHAWRRSEGTLQEATMTLVLQGNFAVKLSRAMLFLFVAAMFCLPTSAHAQTITNVGGCVFLSDATFCNLGINGSFTSQSQGGDTVINSGTSTQTTSVTLGVDIFMDFYNQCFGNLCNSISDTYSIPSAFELGSQATYNLQAGTLSAAFEVIGGTMNQSGGVNQLTDGTATHVHCFNNSCSTVLSVQTVGTLDVAGGTYNLTAGNVQTPLLISDGGGTFNQSGGTVTVLPNISNDLSQPTGSLDAGLYIGENGAGTYNLQSGTLEVGGAYSFSCGSQSTCTGFANGNEYVGYNAGSDGVFNQSGGSNLIGPPPQGASTLGGNLYVGYMGTGVYNMSGGTLAPYFNVNEYIGNLPGSKGTFNQTGGINGVNIATGSNPTYSVLELYVGYMGNGSYTLGAPGGSTTSATLSAGFENIGAYGYDSATNTDVAGTGSFVQNSGTNNVTELNVGAQGNVPGGNFSLSNPQGIYTLNEGIINASQETVGEESAGIFVQNGGINITNSLDIGMGNTTQPGAGEYDLTGGTLEICCSAAQIGQGSGVVGIFNQTGGVNEATEIIVGASGTGTYSLSGANSVLDPSFLLVGDLGSGIFNQTGGTVNLLATFQYNGGTEGGGGTLQVGATGTYNLGCANGSSASCVGAGTLIADNEEIGETVNTSFVGTFNQYAGTTNTVTRGTNGTGTLDVGESGQGVYNMYGGTLTANTENIAQFGATGTFNQSGGTNNVVLGTPSTDVLSVGYNGNGTYNLSGANAGPNATTLNAVNENIGGQGVGTFNQSGGVNNVAGTLIVGDGGLASGAGLYSLSGGTLSATNEIVGNNFASTNALTEAFLQTGGMNDVSGTLTIGASQFNQNAPGAYAIENGTLSASNITVGSNAAFSVNPSSAPSGTGVVNLAVSGTLTNNGVTDFFSGPHGTINPMIVNLVNNGTLNLDPTTLDVKNFTIGANGIIDATGANRLNISGNFTDDFGNLGLSSAWNVASMTLDFTGANTHDIFFASALSLSNLTWGNFILDSGGSLDFQSGSKSLYVDGLDFGGGMSAFADVCGGSIFYDENDSANDSLLTGGSKGSYSNSCGGLLVPFFGATIGSTTPPGPTPEPATWALFLIGVALLAVSKKLSKFANPNEG